MGTFENAERSLLKDTFEATCGDKAGDVEPIFVMWRKNEINVLRGEVAEQGDTLDVQYTILDATIDDADAARILHIAYLDIFTSHDWYNEFGGRFPQLKLRLTNRDSGVTSTTSYPDPE